MAGQVNWQADKSMRHDLSDPAGVGAAVFWPRTLGIHNPQTRVRALHCRHNVRDLYSLSRANINFIPWVITGCQRYNCARGIVDVNEIPPFLSAVVQDKGPV